MTFVEPDVAADLAKRLPLYCADRVDAVCTEFAQSFRNAMTVTAEFAKTLGEIGKIHAEVFDALAKLPSMKKEQGLS